MMTAAKLKTELQNLTPTGTEAAAASTLATGWDTYFADSASNGVPYSGAPGPKSAMQSALSGMSASGAGAAKIQAAVTAYWTAIVGAPAVAFPGATLVTPPATLSTIAAALAPVFASNVSGGVSLSTAAQNVANALHPLNLGGTATFPGPVVAPIL